MGTLLACTHSLPAGLLSTLLAQSCGLRHLGLCDSLPEVLEALEVLQPDLLLLEGIAAAAPAEAILRSGKSHRPTDRPKAERAGENGSRIHADWQRLIAHPAIVTGRLRLVLLPPFPDNAPPQALIAAAWIVLRDSCDWQELLQGSRALQDPQPQEVCTASTPLPEAGRFRRLRPHEQRVLSLVATGLSNKQIARQLGLTCSTVETYRKTISAKLDLSGSQLLRAAVLHQCLQLQPPARLMSIGDHQAATGATRNATEPERHQAVDPASRPERRRRASQRVVPLHRNLGTEEAAPQPWP